MDVTVESNQNLPEILKILKERSELVNKIVEIDTRLNELQVHAVPWIDMAKLPEVQQLNLSSLINYGKPKIVYKSLGELVLKILEIRSSGLNIAEIVRLCLENGYRSKADNFKNMVEQQLYKLVNSNLVERDKTEGIFSLIQTKT